MSRLVRAQCRSALTGCIASFLLGNAGLASALSVGFDVPIFENRVIDAGKLQIKRNPAAYHANGTQILKTEKLSDCIASALNSIFI